MSANDLLISGAQYAKWANLFSKSLTTNEITISNDSDSGRFRVPVYSALPVAPIPDEGHLGFYNDELYFSNGTVWVLLDASSGDVESPNPSTNNAITRFDGITGRVLKTSATTLDDTGSIGCTALSTLGSVRQYSSIFPATFGVPSINKFYISTANVIITTLTETDLLSTGIGTTTMPANSLVVGTCLHIQVMGAVKTAANRTPTLRLKLNGVTVASNVVTLEDTAGVTSTFEYNSYFVIRSVGVGGTAVYNGLFSFNDNGTIKGGSLLGTPTINTTIDNTVSLTLQFNTITSDNLTSTIASISGF
jgi:hypothetical protein